MTDRTSVYEEGPFSIRFAVEEDTPLILDFIKELASYEKMSDEVTADTETLRESLFNDHGAEVLIGSWHDRPVSFALFFHNFSTFLGKKGLYLEDLYVKPEMRGKGIGLAMMKTLAGIAKRRGCGRMEWWCLDWNEPSIEFYRRIGAKPMNDWTVFRITENDFDILLGSGERPRE